MQLFSGSAELFINYTNHNQIALELRDAFFNYFGYYPSDAEVNSWRNSLDKIKNVFQVSNLKKQGILLEYFLPSTSLRLDCMITGKDIENKDNAVIIELKQWQKTEESDCDNEVLTFLGGHMKEVLHPSYQVYKYQKYFEDFYDVFYKDNPIKLNSCAYLHNYEFEENDPILNNKFKEILNKSPIFALDDFDNISKFINDKVSYGDGLEVIERINDSTKRPSKKLMESVYKTINSESDFKLLDEQQIVYDKCMSCIKNGISQHKHHILIVDGGPGTGKSVIAINLLADLCRDGYYSEYVTGSKAFTETLRKKVKNNELFKYTHQFTELLSDKDKIDVLIVDEAHRLRKTSASRYKSTDGRSQVEEIINSSRVSVFFIDDNQKVRPGEIGSIDYIESEAERLGCVVWKTKLEAQFRCSGNQAFVNWIDNTLQIKKTANPILNKNDNYDFKIFDDPLIMENELKKRIIEGNTARIVAGFVWEWHEYAVNGKLINDVKINNYERPWNASSKCVKLDKAIPKQSYWATQDGGFNQIGCVYTAQGFEFDYVGVIIGDDIVYRFQNNNWIAQPDKCKDTVVKRGKDFLNNIKDTYRVLLSRGIKGCYVYFLDKETENFVKSRLDF